MIAEPQKTDPTLIEAARRKERIRRNRELLAAGLMIIIVLIFSWLQINHYGKANSLFLFSMNLNTALLLAICFLIAKNLYRLFLERRRKLFGAKLRSRLLIAFIAVALIPIGIMFFAANQLISSRLDFLFTGETSEAMSAALDLARTELTEQQQHLHEQAQQLQAELQAGIAPEPALAASGLNAAAYLSYPASDAPPVLTWLGAEQPVAWQAVESLFNYENYQAHGFDAAISDFFAQGGLLGLLRISDGTGLLVARQLEPGLYEQLQSVSQGYEHYTQMRGLNKPIRYSYTLMLGIMALTVIFLAIWLALRFSRQITGPVQALSKGAEQLAAGDLDFQLLDDGRDELGQLVASFNLMAEKLKNSHEALLRSNQLLADKSRALELRNNFTETVLDSVSTGIVTLDADGKIITLNKALCAIMAIQAADWLGAYPEQLMQVEYARKITQIRHFLAQNPERIWQEQTEFVRKGRNIKLFMRAMTLPGNEHNSQPYGSLLFLLDDVTELASLQRLEAWQEVARRIAHEIKNPLTPIKLSAQRLQRRFGNDLSDPVFNECASLIIKETDRMHKLVTDFTSFAALPKVTPVNGDLLKVVSGVLAVMRSAHEQINWQLEAPACVPELKLDSEAMHRALLNLLTNSAEALAAAPEQKQPQVAISIEQQPGLLRLEIRDNGPGLAEEDIPRLFEPYFSRKKNGTGLGLAIARAILQEHKAEIQARNIPDGGTLIQVEFELDEPNPADA